jgi:hypothetical protein
MLFKQVAAIAAFSVITEAFLIPPQISKTDIDIVKALPIELTQGGARKTVQLECTGCPVPEGNVNGMSVNLQHVTSTLELNYVVKGHENAVDRLILNGVSIYPPDMASIEPFKASQKFSEDQPFETQKNVPLGYEMTVKPVMRNSDMTELIAIDLHIFEVGDKFINGIDMIELHLLKTTEGKLTILHAEKLPSTSPAVNVASITEEDKDCTSLLCKWRAIVAAKLAHLKPFTKGCGKGKGSKAGAISSHKGQGRPHGGRPHHSQGQHHQGHRHHRHHGFARVMRMLRSISIHVLIPIFIGIAAGLTASVIGMVIGHLVVLVWRTIRGGSPAYSRVALDDVADEESKIIIIEPQEPPPVYEDVVIIEEASEEKERTDA